MADIDRHTHPPTVPSGTRWKIHTHTSPYRTIGEAWVGSDAHHVAVELPGATLWTGSPALLRAMSRALSRPVPDVPLHIDVGAGMTISRFPAGCTCAWIASDHVLVGLDDETATTMVALGCLDAADQLNEARWRASLEAVTP